MKKKTLLSMALLSAVIAVSSTSLTAYAAGTCTTKVLTNNCYKVYIGQGGENLSQKLKELGITLENIGNLCPGAQKPDTDTPETSTPPVTDETTLSYAEEIVRLVNEERAKAGLPALVTDTEITTAANVRAKEIKQSFSHTRPDGSSFSTALKEQGVAFRGSGENIAWGQKTPEQVMNGWMNSEGHRANILNKNFKNIGVGYYQDANGVNYWVQLFTY